MSASSQLQKVRFSDQTRSEFFPTVRKRVDAYFKENNISKHANAAMIFKTVLFVGTLMLSYGLIISSTLSPLGMLFWAGIMGATTAFIGFNVCHDAIHGSYSANARVNQALSLLFNVIGANAYMWSITHNVVHHTYTNIPEHDEDLDVAPGLVRLSPHDKIHPIQRFQHFYAFFLYSFASLSWVFRKDFKKFFAPKIGAVDTSNHPKSELFNLLFFKILYVVIFMVVPFIVMSLTWYEFLLGFLFMHMVQGLVLGLVFQLAHVVEGMQFPQPNDENTIEEAWAIHQMNTTANFARKSKLANFFCGGLNFQIEHHLFPKVCHIHYAAISDIVKQTALEHNVPYIEHETFFSAIASHYRILKKFGKGDFSESPLRVSRVRA
jgi:linoleoyl-CoA desaturase